MFSFEIANWEFASFTEYFWFSLFQLRNTSVYQVSWIYIICNLICTFKMKSSTRLFSFKSCLDINSISCYWSSHMILQDDCLMTDIHFFKSSFSIGCSIAPLHFLPKTYRSRKHWITKFELQIPHLKAHGLLWHFCPSKAMLARSGCFFFWKS